MSCNGMRGNDFSFNRQFSFIAFMFFYDKTNNNFNFMSEKKKQ